MLGNRYDVGARHFSDGQAAVRLIGCIEIDVVGTDTCSYAQFQVLGLRQTLSCEVARVESAD